MDAVILLPGSLQYNHIFYLLALLCKIKKRGVFNTFSQYTGIPFHQWNGNQLFNQYKQVLYFIAANLV